MRTWTSSCAFATALAPLPPALDVHVTREARAMLLNFENLLSEDFGEDAALGDQLAVPLQLSGIS